MKQFLIDYKSPIIVLLCTLGLEANSFVWQYWLNPLGTIIGLPLGLLLIYFTFSPVFSLLWKKYRTKKAIGVIGATVLACGIGIAASMFVPNGVAVRLSQFSERDFHEVSDLIDAASEEYGDGFDDLLSIDKNYQSILKELKANHAIFNLSSFPMRVCKEEDHTSIGWYGGLAGGYDVVIFDKANPPERLVEYRVVYLYDTVAFYEIEDYANGQ